MYLKRLEMLGFKSFAIRTVLECSTGITAVVGPNGAGKSNVADAMRWVLGEQSMRQLRGKKSDDIIFVGGHGKAAQGMAEVSLTIDNSTGWVPSEYSEITVTRRSYRSGENEYLINKQKVRLRDVVLLLAQARIGHDSYTVVGQGLIDAALSLRAEERRGLFEDAAGIRPFQVQRADAENRLRQTEANLERLRDIVNEIEPRLQPLQEQAHRAVEYAQLNGELQEVLLTWYALQWRRLRTAREMATVAEQEQAQHVLQLTQSIEATEEQGKVIRSNRQSIRLQIAEARRLRAEANDVVQRIGREVAVNEERATGLVRQRNDQQQEERRLRERLIVSQQQQSDAEEQCDLADEAVDTFATTLAALEAQVSRAQKDYDAEERRLRAAQHDLIQVQARLGASQTDVGRQQKHMGERNRMLASRKETIAQSQQAMRTLETRLTDDRSRLEEVRSEEQQLSQRKQMLFRAMAEAQQESDHLKVTLAEAERQRRLVNDRLTMLKHWRQSLSGYSDGVRNLLRAAPGKVTGLVGVVAQLGVAPAGMEAAIEAALGPYLQAAVVQTQEDAYASLSYLRSGKLGRAIVLWQDTELADKYADESFLQSQEAALEDLLAESTSLQKRVLGFAWRQIQCEPDHHLLFRRLLHGVVIVEDIESARALCTCAVASRNPPFEGVVTRKGEVLHLDGWLSGGIEKEGNFQGLLAYERELRELPQQLLQHIATIDQLNENISAIQRAQEGRRVEQIANERELQKILGRANEMNKQLVAIQREQDRLQTELQLAVSMEQQLMAEIIGLEQEVQAAQERVRVHEKAQRDMSSLVEELQGEMEERASHYRRQQEELGKARTTLAVKRQEAKAQHQQLAVKQAQVQDAKTQVEQHLLRLKEAEQWLQVLQETIASQYQELASAQSREQALSQQLHVVEEQANEIERQLTSLEQRTVQLRHLQTEAETIYRRALLDSQKAHDAVEALLAQLAEEMDITDPTKLSEYAAQVDAHVHRPGEVTVLVPETNSETETLTEEEEARLRKLRRRVDGLRSRLKALGGCDPDAPQQYEELRTRFEFLSSQISDMHAAALHLRAIIGQLDVTMARQFEVTFQAVNARFRDHFTTLFNGGTARLELLMEKAGEDEAIPASHANRMPAGIEVIVQPPGKKVQDLSLLSGGERALVSAALLFALLESNPPPFCLLDEVDAALDESNVTRFCDILKRLAQRTQFIVITHNRVTMTAAQVIYGVSMGSDSVSRLLSMRLEEAAVAGDR